MKRPTSTALKFNSSSFLYGWILVGLNIVISAVFWWQLPPQIPLFYSLPYGTSQLANREWFLLLPLLSIVLLVSYLLICRLKVQSRIFYDVIKWLHLLGLFLIFVAIIHIVILVL